MKQVSSLLRTTMYTHLDSVSCSYSKKWPQAFGPNLLLSYIRVLNVVNMSSCFKKNWIFLLLGVLVHICVCSWARSISVPGGWQMIPHSVPGYFIFCQNCPQSILERHQRIFFDKVLNISPITWYPLTAAEHMTQWCCREVLMSV